MYAVVNVTGMVTKVHEMNKDKFTFINLRSARTIQRQTGPETSYANILLKMKEGYEEHAGKIEMGDFLVVRGRFDAEDGKGPVFGSDGLPHFVVIPFQVMCHGPVNNSVQSGNDIFMVTIIGNLGQDPESKFLDGGSQVTNASVATSRKYLVSGSKTTETIWWRCAFWNKSAETAATWLKKGMRVAIDGNMQYDVETGGPKVFTRRDASIGASFEISVNSFTMLGGNGGGAPAQHGSIPQDDYEEEGVAETPASSSDDDQVPF